MLRDLNQVKDSLAKHGLEKQQSNKAIEKKWLLDKLGMRRPKRVQGRDLSEK